MQTKFLKRPALLHFMHVVLDKAVFPNNAAHFLELHFLDDTAKRVKDEIWMEICLDSGKSVRPSRNQKVTYEAVLNDVIL